MRPVFLVENLFSRRQFAGHVLLSSSELPGYEAFRVAAGRRHPTNAWRTGREHSDEWLLVDCGAARTADMIAIDREQNLAGQEIRVQHSADAATWTTVADVVFPAATAATDLDGADGVLTTEGAWLKRFAPATACYWRLYVVGAAGFYPSITGLVLGESWQPALHPDLPWSDSTYELLYSGAESDAGWIGAGRATRRRTGTLALKLKPEEYESARYHLEENYARRRPMWIVFDPAQADRALYAVHPQGGGGFSQQSGWFGRQTQLGYVEHEPAIAP